jgi:hypothetical protein
MNSAVDVRVAPSDLSALSGANTCVDSSILLHRWEKQLARSVKVPNLSRNIHVKIASERWEWESALRLVGANYQACGYETPMAQALRFTRYHALPDTMVFVAIHGGEVLLTFTLVPDNTVLGLPMESIYEDEIRDLRSNGRRIAEVTSLADRDLSQREFWQVFVALSRLLKQYHVRQGGDTWVIAVNPRHRSFYTRKFGYTRLGGCRSYPTVQGAPAEGYVCDLDLMQTHAPKMYHELFDRDLPASVVKPAPMPRHLVQYFGNQVGATVQTVREIFSYHDALGNLRRW